MSQSGDSAFCCLAAKLSLFFLCGIVWNSQYIVHDLWCRQACKRRRPVLASANADFLVLSLLLKVTWLLPWLPCLSAPNYSSEEIGGPLGRAGVWGQESSLFSCIQEQKTLSCEWREPVFPDHLPLERFKTPYNHYHFIPHHILVKWVSIVVWLFNRWRNCSIRKLFKVSPAAKSLQSCPTPCDPTDGSPPGSSVDGIFQAGTLEWVAIAFSKSHPG